MQANNNDNHFIIAPKLREPLNLLREHPEGLSAEQIRGLLNATKPIGDTLQGMRRGNLVRTEGSGREMRYFHPTS